MVAAVSMKTSWKKKNPRMTTSYDWPLRKNPWWPKMPQPSAICVRPLSGCVAPSVASVPTPPNSRPKPTAQYAITPMAKITKLVMITCTAFLERQKPVSTSAKPACMKNTSAPPKITKKRLSEALTCPSSAASSAVVGLPAILAAMSVAPPVAQPVGSPA